MEIQQDKSWWAAIWIAPYTMVCVKMMCTDGRAEG